MVIVSQDRNVIFNFSGECEILYQSHHYPETHEIEWNIFASAIDTTVGEPLGSYDNEDRCEGILNDILTAIKDGEKIFYMPEE